MAYSEAKLKGNDKKYLIFSDNSQYKMYHIFAYVEFTTDSIETPSN